MAASAPVKESTRPTVQKVLLVDDHEMYLKYCSREFVKAGVEVAIASSVETALSIVENEGPEVAIVDLFLTPPDTGLDVIRALKEADPNLFCILVSAHMSVSHALMGVRAGADDVFLKPFGAKQTIARVERGVVDRPHEETPTLHEIEWEHISRVLHDHAGNVSRAAESLGVFRQSLQRKIAKHAPRALAVDPSATEASEPGPYERLPAPYVPPPPPPEPPAPRPRAKSKKKARPIKRRGH